MTSLKDKSKINIGSALVLTGKQETCLSSVHCAYYGCYQLIIHYLDTAFSYDNDKRKAEYDSYLETANGGKTLGSHEYWISKFTGFIKKPGNIFNSLQIDKNIRVLREARTEADYQETDFSKKQTDELYETARDTIKMIDKSFE
jgi:hypothetical protein